MTKRSFLVWLFVGVLVLGAGFASVPFVGSMSPGPGAEDDAWVACDVANLEPGKIQQCGWLWVYRRTEADKKAVHRFEHLLADPRSAEPFQPEAARNEWRSANPDYFIFQPWSSWRRCEVELRQGGAVDASWAIPEKEALQALPHFVEGRESRTWDTSGRLYKRDGYPLETNLFVPKVNWVSPTKVYIWVERGQWSR